MSLSYQRVQDSLDALIPIQEECIAWYNAVLLNVFYASDIKAAPLTPCARLAEWLDAMTHENIVREDMLHRIKTTHDDIQKTAASFLNTPDAKPAATKFQHFAETHEALIGYLCRVEKDLMTDGLGYDSFFDLRSSNMLMHDIEREMARFIRHGRSFCTALIHVDDYDLIVQHHNKREVKGFLKDLANLIKVSIRPFDDAYYLGNNAFALCLKHTDINGGVSALERLKRALIHGGIKVNTGLETESQLSVTCCVAEPFDGDTAENIINNLHTSLEEMEQDTKNAVLRYQELSALERYMLEQA